MQAEDIKSVCHVRSRSSRRGCSHLADPATVYEIAAHSPGYPEWGSIGSFEEVRPGEIDISPEGEGTRIDWYSSFYPPKGFGWFWKLFMQNVLSTMSAALVKEAERRVADKRRKRNGAS